MLSKDLKDMYADEKFKFFSSIIPNIKKAAKTNDAIKHMRNVVKGKTEQNEAVICGISMIENVTKSDIRINCLVVCPDEIFTQRAQQAVYEASKKTQTVLSVSSSTFTLLGAKKNSNGFAMLIEMPFKKIRQIKACDIYIVLDSLELPGNVGTLIRTADGAGLKSVIITNPKIRMNNPTMLAASRAAFINVDIVIDTADNIANWAQENDIDIVLADTRAKETHLQIDLSSKVCFVVGCERYGIDDVWFKKKHRLVKIPMLGVCDSLNVGVAGSILIYEALRQKIN